MPIFLRSVSLWIAITLTIPTSLILVTWKALPGENLYGVKRGLEEVPRVAFGKTQIAADYEVAIADRRFSEATTLVKTNHTAGLVELKKSITQATTVVTQTQNETAKTKLVDNLIVYQKALGEQKKTVFLPAVEVQPVQKPQVIIATVSPKPQVIPQKPLDTVPRLSEEKKETVRVIEETEKEIEKTIKELKKNKNKSATGGRVPFDGKVPETKRKVDKKDSNKKGDSNSLPGQKTQESPDRESEH